MAVSSRTSRLPEFLSRRDRPTDVLSVADDPTGLRGKRRFDVAAVLTPSRSFPWRADPAALKDDTAAGYRRPMSLIATIMNSATGQPIQKMTFQRMPKPWVTFHLATGDMVTADRVIASVAQLECDA
jgi:hypothetical protein